MKFHPNHFYLIENSARKNSKLFYSENNYHYFIRKINAELKIYGNIIGYVLLPDKFQILFQTNNLACSDSNSVIPGERHYVHKQYPNFKYKPMPALSHAIGKLLSSYANAINRQKNQNSKLFGGKTKIKEVAPYVNGIEDEAIKLCLSEMYNEPVKLRLVKKEIEWKFSTAKKVAS